MQVTRKTISGHVHQRLGPLLLLISECQTQSEIDFVNVDNKGFNDAVGPDLQTFFRCLYICSKIFK